MLHTPDPVYDRNTDSKGAHNYDNSVHDGHGYAAADDWDMDDWDADGSDWGIDTDADDGDADTDMDDGNKDSRVNVHVDPKSLAIEHHVASILESVDSGPLPVDKITLLILGKRQPKLKVPELEDYTFSRLLRAMPKVSNTNSG